MIRVGITPHMATYEIGISPMYRILKKAGAGRVSTESAEELRRVVEDYAARIARRSVDLAAHAKRKTIKAEDVRLSSS